MNRTYTAQSPYSLTPTERIRSSRKGRRYGGGHGDLDGDLDADHYANRDTDVLPSYPDDDYGPLDYDDYGPIDGADDYDDADYHRDEYGAAGSGYDDDEARIDRRWMWIAGVAGAILFVSVITASLILGGGDSGSVSATIVSTDATTSAAPAPTSAPSVAAAPSLPPETVTTVTPPPSPTAQTPAAQPVLPAPQAAPPVAAAPGTVTYRITVRAAPFGAPRRPKPEQRLREGARVFRIAAVAEDDADGRYLTCFAQEEVPA